MAEKTVRKNMTENRRSSSVQGNRGFTMIELATVMAVMGILAAIAIPNFVTYKLRAYHNEAEVLLGAIASAQMHYKLRHGVFVACPPNPPARKGQWKSDMPEWNRIRYKTGGKYYQFEVIADPTGFVAYARGKTGSPVETELWEISSRNLEPVQKN